MGRAELAALSNGSERRGDRNGPRWRMMVVADPRGIENRLARPSTKPASSLAAVASAEVSVRRGQRPSPRVDNYIDQVAESVSMDGDTYLVLWWADYSARVTDMWV